MQTPNGTRLKPWQIVVFEISFISLSNLNHNLIFFLLLASCARFNTILCHFNILMNFQLDELFETETLKTFSYLLVQL